MEGKIRLDGNVNIYLMYLADGEGRKISAFNANLDFTEILDFQGIDPKMTLDENVEIKSIECKVLNGRKVGFKVLVEINAKVFLNENENMIKEINGVEDIQLQTKTLKMNSLVGQNSTRASAKENIAIDEVDEVAEILGVNFNIINKDTKISYNKVLAKADVNIEIIYINSERSHQKSRR